MVVGPRKTNLNVHFWLNWVKDDVTHHSEVIKNSGYYARMPTMESV